MQIKTHCHFCGTPLIEKSIEGRERLYCRSCEQPLYENPTPAACVVVIDEEDNILLVKRSIEPHIGSWCLPGGFIELGEQPEEAALRELKEETGLSGRIDRLLGVVSQHSKQYHTVLIAGYLVKEYSERLVAGDDASEIAFYCRDELPRIPFTSHREFIRTYYFG